MLSPRMFYYLLIAYITGSVRIDEKYRNLSTMRNRKLIESEISGLEEYSGMLITVYSGRHFITDDGKDALWKSTYTVIIPTILAALTLLGTAISIYFR